MSKITIIEGNSNDKDNTRAYMVKGEKGVSPTVSIEEDTGKVDITITDYTGAHTTEISDPVVSLSKSNHVATISVTDKNGTNTTTVADGADLTDGAVPTGAVIGFDGTTIPGGFEEVDGFDIYSTDEIKIGTWIDGKTLYRKVFSTNVSVASETWTNLRYKSGENSIIKCVYSEDDNFSEGLFPCLTRFSGNYIQVYSPIAITIKSYIIEYTKL